LANKKFTVSDNLDKKRQLFGTVLIRSVSRQVKQKGSQRLISNCLRLQQYLIPDPFSICIHIVTLARSRSATIFIILSDG